MKLYDEEIRYPKNGDKFFIEEGHPDEKAWLNRHFQEFVTYADGYQTGALNLIEDALKNRSLRDIHVYPAVFLIRHFLELRLKELIQGLNYCNKQKKEFPQHHKVQNLWDDFKKAYKEFGGDIQDKRFKVVDNLVNEISNIDPNSMAFRYPVDINGKSTQKLDCINIANLKETFIRVSFLFDGLSLEIANYVDITEDMLKDIYFNH